MESSAAVMAILQANLEQLHLPTDVVEDLDMGEYEDIQLEVIDSIVCREPLFYLDNIKGSLSCTVVKSCHVFHQSTWNRPARLGGKLSKS